MKVVNLAGGLGTRISEESQLVPKAMIKIGGEPILWHIMQYCASFGHREFIILAGYKQEVIKDYFNNYYLHNSDTTFYLKDQSKSIVKSYSDDSQVTVLDTELYTHTASHLLYANEYLVNEELFLLTYGDGFSDVDFYTLVKSHSQSGAYVTLTAIRPKGRFGLLDINKDNLIKSFKEKSDNDTNWINGGFMVVNPSIYNFIRNDNDVLETDVLPIVAEINSIYSYKHYGFWQAMDTLRDKELLENLISQLKTPWIK